MAKEKQNNFVSLGVCYYCLQEGSSVVIHTRFGNLPERAVYDTTPCHKCEAFMKQGIILISIADGAFESEEKKKREYDNESARINEYRLRHRPPYLYNPFRTGGWWVLKDEAIKKAVDAVSAEQMIRRRWSFIENAAAQMLGLFGDATAQAAS